ncbi:MAG: hypothetical protein WKF76_09370 [Nocardioidaceae bacterium]
MLDALAFGRQELDEIGSAVSLVRSEDRPEIRPECSVVHMVSLVSIGAWDRRHRGGW